MQFLPNQMLICAMLIKNNRQKIMQPVEGAHCMIRNCDLALAFQRVSPNNEILTCLLPQTPTKRVFQLIIEIHKFHFFHSIRKSQCSCYILFLNIGIYLDPSWISDFTYGQNNESSLDNWCIRRNLCRNDMKIA